MLVMQGVFPLQSISVLAGLTHDLSKLSPWNSGPVPNIGRTPANRQRKAGSYSTAWLHHKGHNKHHLESFRIDYAPQRRHAMAGDAHAGRYVAGNGV